MRIGETFKDGRYTVLYKLGWGHFSTVWMVRDGETGGLGALKVVKSASHYAEAARDEIQLLTALRDGDPRDERCCARLLDSFDHVGPHGRHVCMLFEVLGDNLLTLIRMYDHRGVPLRVARALARQCLVALDFLHTGPGIIHTDVKPENVMLRDPIKPRRRPQPGAEQAAPAPQGKLAAALAAGQKLTKAQRRRLKLRETAKAAKAAAKATGADERAGADEPAGADNPARAEEPARAAEPAELASTELTSAELAGVAERGLATAGGAIAAVESREPTAPLSLHELEERLVTMPAKVVDFGNACWVRKHFTDDIQTRQYRSPEVGRVSLCVCGEGWEWGGKKGGPLSCWWECVWVWHGAGLHTPSLLGNSSFFLARLLGI